MVVESTPKDRATLQAAPQTAELRFNVRIEQSLARASLRRGREAAIALTPQRLAASDAHRLVVPLPALSAGAYELHYHVLAADGHTTQGLLRFTVRP